ncbi:MarR family winged helix-turn-helix transcriptional regulator [Rhodococcus sp. IEGM 1330]|uniref:MarR family winged helix-turn-helix transcriptional regulator n=1 Tax=Rhodococcus sp. IEGM 1330 TaxID=3082225 RepID=UPI002954F35E|nr:MarR family transcriptional regulator [Rhodococcus sp. IEGM 1330]MDV8022712.1 MarR family transcriptional regulator [Rhodococcus sp. IEGM 1330]
MTQYTVLLTLSDVPDMSGAQLARSCGVTQQSMAGVLNGLHRKRLIARQQSDTHGRVVLSNITTEGSLVLGRALIDVERVERTLAGSFTPEEHAAFCDFLIRTSAVFTGDALD